MGVLFQLWDLKCVIYVKHKVLTTQSMGKDRFTNPHTWLTLPLEDPSNSATDILLSTAVMRLARDPFRISLVRMEGKFVLFFKQNILFQRDLLIKIEYHLFLVDIIYNFSHSRYHITKDILKNIYMELLLYFHSRIWSLYLFILIILWYFIQPWIEIRNSFKGHKNI